MNATDQLTNIYDIHEKQLTYFKAGNTLAVSDRILTLKKIKTLIQENYARFETAIEKDLKKSPYELYTHEISGIIAEINYLIKNVKSFSKGKKVRSSLAVFPSKSIIKPTPKGQVLIFAPWNYPVLLTIRPIVTAIAAGNTVMFKPSELTPCTSDLIIELFNGNFDHRLIYGVGGDKDTAQQLLCLEFDHIFFTGSTQVGKIVYEQAAKKLTPVTLELGGKSPCILDRHINLKAAAKKIAWGKSINSGQTCVAPDYVLLPEASKTEFIEHFKYWIKKFYGSSVCKSKDYSAIVSKRHFDRLKQMMESSTVLCGGELNEDLNKIAPTIIEVNNDEAPVATEEIFGPILPVYTYRESIEIFERISKSPNPLALYVFSDSEQWADQIIEKVPCGGVVINDLILHLAHDRLPFGGIRQSGIGRYHKGFGLEELSHMRPVMRKPSSLLFDLPLRYAPYTSLKTKIIKVIFGL